MGLQIGSIRFVSLLLTAVLLNVHHSMGMQRPDFMDRIKGTVSKPNGFDDIKDSIVGNSLSGLELHLAHVFPWAAIDKCVDNYWKNSQVDLTKLVKAIFKLDTQAIVPMKWVALSIPKNIKKTSKHTTKAVIKTNIKTKTKTGTSTKKGVAVVGQSVKKHNTYLGHDLRTENQIMENEALISCVSKGGSITDQEECKKLLFSSPANLRYGLGNLNVQIGNRLDFMGNGLGKFTNKERDLIEIMKECYMSIDVWCARKDTKAYCASNVVGGKTVFGILSSSSNAEFIYP